MPGTPEAEALERLKRASLGQVLLRAARLFNEASLSQVEARTGFPLRLAHTQLLPHLGREGIRATELSRRVGISKQAVGELLAEMLAWGVLERLRDPADGRAWIVRLTPAGQAATVKGLAVLEGVARDLESSLGAERLVQLHADLSALSGALERRAATDR
jgi:DNA-binding MarR family transcriptional regulator